MVLILVEYKLLDRGKVGSGDHHVFRLALLLEERVVLALVLLLSLVLEVAGQNPDVHFLLRRHVSSGALLLTDILVVHASSNLIDLD